MIKAGLVQFSFTASMTVLKTSIELIVIHMTEKRDPADERQEHGLLIIDKACFFEI
jgi:hypothetical protein